MARYPNGGIPRELLHRRVSGGKSDAWLMPGTAEKYDRLVELGRQRYGWTPIISGPDDAYRSLDRQWYYWNTLPFPQAANPGTSSHGGEYNGWDSGALDIGNWGVIGKSAFYELAREAGFEPNYFDWEPWHIIDWSPWTTTPAPTPEPDPVEPEEEDEDMKETYVWWKNAAGKQQNLVYATGGNGMADYWESNNGEYNTRVAQAHNLAGPTAEISESHGNALLKKLAEQRAAK